MINAENSSKRRFATWCKLGGTPLTTFGRLVEERLATPLLAAGFERVDVHGWDATHPVGGSEILLERPKDGDVQAVSFTFDKRHHPAVQVHLIRWAAGPPHARVRYASVVKRSRQYVCSWGKPWWLPAQFWSARASARVVERLAGLLGQSLAFLDHGERGPKISRPIGAPGGAPPEGGRR